MSVSAGSAAPLHGAAAGDVVFEIDQVYRLFVGGGARQGGAKTALRDVSLNVRRGEFLTFIGPSGCGKSTVLNMLAGLLRPTSGSVRYHGAEVRKINTSVGYITQDDNLLPWRTLIDNVAFVLELQGM